MEAVSAYINDLGAAVVLPVLIAVFAMALGQNFSRSVRSGVLIGVGFVGINLVIGLLGNSISPVAQALAGRLNVDLDIIDVGWPSSAAIAFGSQVGAVIIPFCLALNVVLLLCGLTRTFDIDLWNYWHFALGGALVAVVMDSFWWGLFAAGVAMIAVLALADLAAPMIQKYFGFPDISFPHGTSAPYALLAIPLNRLMDKIPGLNKIEADPVAIQRRFGIFGETLFVGLVIGLLLGIAGFGFDDPREDSIGILTLGITVAAVMVILPRMVAILMEGLVPVSEAARDFMAKRFPGRKYYIGLDSAIAVGQPAVIATSLILVPVTLLVAIALAPLGNRVLPLVDLATIPFIVAVMVPIFRGNIVRSVIGGAIAIGGGLFIATALAPTFTSVALASGFENSTGSNTISSLVDGANPLTGALVALSELGPVGPVAGLVIALAFALFVRRIVLKRDEAEAQAQSAAPVGP
ncbi:PTS galactitol transporter subunit IIC [Nocardioides sp. cx-173]|uniref:PTS galactitol transporter subunit IIC n=1 Tax=Nocardioides sp. cx-173 TaxID=2898796 RepID=UPI001E624B82|nr:PTS transporter subunit IIC [Nocardioides sp. cx-173]MCD4526513.1 PTS galactitol transporter subunit IIC [Nocardioides sp. cx-173]UGB41200.1 PTS galactitol transporter subunit IIC [Nocardioides sp. cx-173]